MAQTDAGLRIAVLDAGPLIHLDELGELALLTDFPECMVPPTVRAEAERHRAGLFARTTQGFRFTPPQQPAPPELAAIARHCPLHTGEIEALCLALEHDADLLLTDDTAARVAARRLSIPAQGTLGVLLRAIRRGQRSPRQVEAVLQAIPKRSSLHVRPALLEEIIQQVRGIG
jgi:predicted nucleic acid-binding protein